MTVKRILIPDHDYDGTAIAGALNYFYNLISEDESYKDCLLYVPVNGTLDGKIESALGKGITKELKAKKPLPVKSSTLRLVTNKTLNKSTKGDLVLVFFPDQKMMDKVDANKNFKMIICVPHVLSLVEQWVRTWDPDTLEGEETETILIDNNIIVAALEALTNVINLSHSHALNSSDAETVKSTLLILKYFNNTDDPINIRNWCVKNNWQPALADEVMKYAKKIFGSQKKPINAESKKIHANWVSTSDRKN